MTRLLDKRWFRVLKGDNLGFGVDFTDQILEYLCDDPDSSGYVVLMQPGYDRNGKECNVARNRHCCVTLKADSVKEIFDTDHLPPEETYAQSIGYVIAERRKVAALLVARYYDAATGTYVEDIDKATVYSFDEVMSMPMPENGFPYPKDPLAVYVERINKGRERMRQIEESEKTHFRAMYNRDIFEWKWEETGPPHPGVWAYGGCNPDVPNNWSFKVGLHTPTHQRNQEGWYYYIGPWPIFKSQEDDDEPVPKA